MNCVVTLPPNALSATGLSTPWTVTGCDQTVTPTFAECSILSPNGTLAVYSPLLINFGSTNFIAPTRPILPQNAVVGCWFGTNGATTALTDLNNGKDVAAANCIGILNKTLFGQFAACNAAQFFRAANKPRNKIVIPPLGVGLNNKPCYTTRSFQIIDMDPSDNVVTSFLMDPVTKKLAQNTVANKAALPGAMEVTNGSDNLLLDAAYRPALGCTAFTAKNLADPVLGAPVGALALNELQAARLQGPPQALVPPADPFVLQGVIPNRLKQNTYRAAVNQPPAIGTAAAGTRAYCKNMLAITAPGFITDLKFLVGKPSPDAANGKDLLTFLGQRFAGSWAGLGCSALVPVLDVNGNLVVSPITANRDAAGVTQSLTLNTPALVALLMANGGATAEVGVLAKTGVPVVPAVPAVPTAASTGSVSPVASLRALAVSTNAVRDVVPRASRRRRNDRRVVV
ncbi:hypothetical protein BCR33DRAFT_846976 [Rhizoclosmatium globosum]|uniref:Uncharacterized protein n=1 Tax=Rhizoclosmatium globosum TaxID=329046 RepID=A0A1Y2CTY9_9FUNG|nr:hypothetical protein BCR33DRAFT_846976 [Rhizoclosmatium globosum]|eukprot:ORY50518.1 hypothetical protein BCR33DRAFT_846976 [Rhizoclosmatium globosum]